LAARHLRIPSLYTPHALVTLDPTLPRWKRALYGRIERRLAAHSQGLIAVSRDEAEHAESLGIDPRKIHIIPNGIEPIVLSPPDEGRRRLGARDDELLIGFVGRLVPQKAPDLLLEAFATLPARLHAKLVLVGDGPLAGELHRKASALGIASQVHFAGDVPASLMMPAFDLFCLSSRYEGMPYVLLEALSAGLPIVTTGVGGVTLCVEPDKNGLIVPPSNCSDLSAALMRVLDDAALRQRFATASTLLSSRFTLKSMITQTLACYHRVAGSSTAFGKSAENLFTMRQFA
jgi:glycosyltransferase involved in cell wall biosynthesis